MIFDFTSFFFGPGRRSVSSSKELNKKILVFGKIGILYAHNINKKYGIVIHFNL